MTLATMHISSTRKYARRTALTLIILLQTLHFIYQMHDCWTHPQSINRVVLTIAKAIELGFFSVCAFKLVERNWDVKIRRHVIRDSGVDALLWAMVAWSGAVAGGDGRGRAWELIGLVQLIGMDIIVWAEVFGRGVAWVERKVEGDEAKDWKVDGGGMSEKGEKQEV